MENSSIPELYIAVQLSIPPVGGANTQERRADASSRLRGGDSGAEYHQILSHFNREKVY